MKEVVIVGAGASGMMAGITAARRGLSVTVLEHNDKAGKKLLQTGNGRCNLTNTYIAPKCYNNRDQDFALRIIRRFPPDRTIAFFRELEVLCKSRSGFANSCANRYIYPNSDQAATVVSALRDELQRLNAEIVYQADVTEIRPTKTGFALTYSRNGQKHTVTAAGVILATGSKAAPATGSDGSGYALARTLGHRVYQPLPALVPLCSPMKFLKGTAGVRSTCAVSLLVQTQKAASDYGEVQFTDYGISGIPVFQISHMAVEALEQGKAVTAVLDFFPDYGSEQLEQLFVQAASRHAEWNVRKLLECWLNRKLAASLAKELGKPDSSLAGLAQREIQQFVHRLKAFAVDITGYLSFDRAQVCQGGVCTDQLDSDTLESRLVPGLFIVGELVDVDGICGGYNLQWAWSSGYAAGNAVGMEYFPDMREN